MIDKYKKNILKNMKDKINSIDMNEKLNYEEIYNLFKTHSSRMNKEISEKINIFKNNIDFFEFYSNKDIKNLLSIFKSKLSENNDESFTSFKSDIEQYISCISQIILSIKLFLKIKDILAQIVINSKNRLWKLKCENNLENCSIDYLFLYLESLLKTSEDNPKFYSSASTLLSSNISLFEETSKNSLFRKFSSEHKINNFSNVEIKPSIYNNPSTPKFQSESEEDQEQKNSNLDSNENDSPIKHESVLTLSKYVFAEESLTPKHLESNVIDPPIVKPEIKNISTRGRVPKIESFNYYKNKRDAFSGNDLNVKNGKKNHFINLLEMINKIYKKSLINSEEKLKLKQLVIEKSKKIEYFYYNVYKNSKKEKNILVAEIKKMINNL